ncbi:MAG: LmbE family protein, partial [Verrucomicrobiales bacterium]|nr:LmbE family protein [Verrucomicrobiales bacterium]
MMTFFATQKTIPVNLRQARPVIAAFLMISASLLPVSAQDASPAGILQDLKSFNSLATVLHVAAHPDDENTQLITYLARGRGYRMGYLSITRGDGGQNVLGPEFGHELGVARTHELMAARHLDGGRQFFTTALDFGFSKDYKETLKIWDKPQVLGDVVRVIRTFQPDVIVTRFSPQPGNTHGHHTASAVLALEAFSLAGDPKAYPEQLTYLKPWQAKRIMQNGGRGVQIDIGGDDPVTGESFASIAGRSRSMHKTQGFGNFGGGAARGPRMESFSLLAGEPATKDIMDGIDTTWGRIPGGAEVGTLTSEVIEKFDAKNPSASINALLAIRKKVAGLPNGTLVDEKKIQLDHILAECLGLSVRTVISQPEVVPGEPLKMVHTALINSEIPVKWVSVRYPANKGVTRKSIDLKRGEITRREATEKIPNSTPLTQPYWLREPLGEGVFRVKESNLIGQPENSPAFPVENVFEVQGEPLVIMDEPLSITGDGVNYESRRKLEVISPVSLKFSAAVQLTAPNGIIPVSLEVTGMRAGESGAVSLDLPAGWKASPEKQNFKLGKMGDKTSVAFKVTAPSKSSTATVGAHAEINGARYDNQRVEIRYSHLPLLVLQPQAILKTVALDMKTSGHQVGYLPGAGDSVAENIEQMGYAVTSLQGTDLTPDKLKNFDAVVIGIRALNVRKDLAGHMDGLFRYVDGGGT